MTNESASPPELAATLPYPYAPAGIGGWLILPILGFALTIALTFINLLAGLRELEGIRLIFAEASPFSELIAPIILSTLAGIAVIFTAGAALFHIFSKTSRAPATAIFHLCVLVLAAFIEVWADYKITSTFTDLPSDPAVIRDASRSLVAAMIWIPYFMYSKRVHNTFLSARS